MLLAADKEPSQSLISPPHSRPMPRPTQPDWTAGVRACYCRRICPVSLPPTNLPNPLYPATLQHHPMLERIVYWPIKRALLPPPFVETLSPTHLELATKESRMECVMTRVERVVSSAHAVESMWRYISTVHPLHIHRFDGHFSS